MIQKAASFCEKFVLTRKDDVISTRGNPSAQFGYTLESADSIADGVWVDWTWSGNRFNLKNDRHGFYPMFLCQDQHGFAVASDITALIDSGCSTELDDDALAVFLRTGFFVGNDTPFKAISAIPPGSHLIWDSDGFRSESASRHAQSDGVPPSRNAANEKYGKLFQSAIEEFDTGETEKVALPLSGGRDSRHILFALLKANRRPDSCITVEHIPPKSDEDAAIASKVAQFDGLNHIVLPRATDLLEIELEKNRLTNFCADEHAWILPLRNHLRKNSFTTVFDGIGGDVLSAGLFLNEERLRLCREGRLIELAENVLGPEGYLPKMIRPDFYRKWNRKVAVNRLVHELEQRALSPNPVGQFYFWNRTRREIASSSWGILNDPCHVFAPYLSNNLYNFLAALPASYFLDHTFHTEAIARYYPEHAHLAYERKDAPRRTNDWISIAGYVMEAMQYCFLSERSGKYMNVSFFLPRVAKGLVSTAYGTHLRSLFNRAIYLTQLEKLRGRLTRR